jgi:hypothetical protein
MKKTVRSQLGLVNLVFFQSHHHREAIPVTAKTGLLPILNMTVSGRGGQFNEHAGVNIQYESTEGKKKIDQKKGRKLIDKGPTEFVSPRGLSDPAESENY